jgi:hypothetical protein
MTISRDIQIPPVADAGGFDEPPRHLTSINLSQAFAPAMVKRRRQIIRRILRI